jgi:hypothetical protein
MYLALGSYARNPICRFGFSGGSINWRMASFIIHSLHGRRSSFPHVLSGNPERGCLRRLSSGFPTKTFGNDMRWSRERNSPQTKGGYSIISSFHHPLDELDLSCVVHVVRGDAEDGCTIVVLAAARKSLQVRSREIFNHFYQLSVCILDEFDVCPPSILDRLPIGTLKPVTPLQRERAALLACDAPPNDVLPVRAVHDDLPDVVSARCESPSGFHCTHATDRSAEVRAMPGFLVKCFLDRVEEDRDFGR